MAVLVCGGLWKALLPNTLHQLCCCVFCRLRPSLDVLKNPEFDGFRKMLDVEMKRLRRAPGMPIRPKRVEPITGLEMLGLLGSHSPQE